MVSAMAYEVSTHVTLLGRLTRGSDRGAWVEFHQRYAELIRNFARRRGLQPADCDDVVQDVLVALTKALPGFQYDEQLGKFRSYLKTITVRVISRRFCQNRGEVHLEELDAVARDAEADVEVESAWEHEWRQYHLRRAMATINAEFNQADCEAFQRYAVEGGDARDTAETLGLSVDQVYQAKSRILKRLGELLALQVRDEG